MVSKTRMKIEMLIYLFFWIGFVDFEDQRDAADAVKGLDGK